MDTWGDASQVHWRIPAHKIHAAEENGCACCQDDRDRKWAQLYARSQPHKASIDLALEEYNYEIVVSITGKRSGSLSAEGHNRLFLALCPQTKGLKGFHFPLPDQINPTATVNGLGVLKELLPVCCEWTPFGRGFLGSVSSLRAADEKGFLSSLMPVSPPPEEEGLLLLPDAKGCFMGKQGWFAKKVLKKWNIRIRARKVPGDPLGRFCIDAPGASGALAEAIQDRIAKANLKVYPYCICDDPDGWMFVM